MTDQTVTQAYLLGIGEGRGLLRQFQRDGIADKATFAAALDNCKAQLARGFAGDMRELFRGEADFWRNQLAKLASLNGERGA